MEVRQLQIFRALAEELNFTRTAERVHTVQSNVTAQIKALDSSFLCQNPHLAYQQLKASGYQITVSTNADGTPLYKITA